MSDGASSPRQEKETVPLDRLTQSWIDSPSAAGVVVRYLIPVRRQLVAVLGSEDEADEACRVLISHLVAAGFGEHRRGKLRDFLIKAVRSAAKSRWKRQYEAAELEAKLQPLVPESPEWRRVWRDEILARSWRSLERLEHVNPGTLVHSVLLTATRAAQETSKMWAVRIAASTGMTIDARLVEATLPQARQTFANLLREELSATLDDHDPESIESEARELGLTAAFAETGGTR